MPRACVLAWPPWAEVNDNPHTSSQLYITTCALRMATPRGERRCRTAQRTSPPARGIARPPWGGSASPPQRPAPPGRPGSRGTGMRPFCAFCTPCLYTTACREKILSPQSCAAAAGWTCAPLARQEGAALGGEAPRRKKLDPWIHLAHKVCGTWRRCERT